MNSTLYKGGPASDEQPVRAPENSRGPDSQGTPRRPRILVVEDDADIMRCLAVRLKINGFDVSGASDLQSALDLANKCEPDAAIFDVSFPGGDGMMLTQALRANPATADLPVMLLTASMRPGIEEEALAAGANGFMRKPYNADALVKELTRWCNLDDSELDRAEAEPEGQGTGRG